MKTSREFAAMAVAILLAAPGAAMAQDAGGSGAAEKRVMVFGDSLTWGWTPTSPVTPTERHPYEDRWTTALAEELGEGYRFVIEGLSGRTTNIDDPTNPILNGADYLPAAMASHEPLDLVIVMLGTNDTKTYLDRTPLEIGLGAGELVNIIQESAKNPWTEYDAPEVLLISPPPLGETIGAEAAEAFEGSREKSFELPRVYGEIAKLAGEHFFDAGSVIETDGVDGIHFTAEANATLGEAVAGEVRAILGE